MRLHWWKGSTDTFDVRAVRHDGPNSKTARASTRSTEPAERTLSMREGDQAVIMP